jgi:hypothetical protein
MLEYLRPWKVSTLFVGVALLSIGSLYYEAPDWDIPISIVMASLTYITAPWSMRVLLERKWRYWPAMLFIVWFSVDGCYAIYWHFRNPEALRLMREANFPASLSLYGLCGIFWMYQGTLKQFISDVGKHVRICLGKPDQSD